MSSSALKGRVYRKGAEVAEGRREDWVESTREVPRCGGIRPPKPMRRQWNKLMPPHWLLMGTAVGYRRSLFQTRGNGSCEITRIHFCNQPFLPSLLRPPPLPLQLCGKSKPCPTEIDC
jgi:hypothetical protein